MDTWYTSRTVAYFVYVDMNSPEIEKELERRIAAGSYESVDELLREAPKALDDARDIANDFLEQELLKGLEGEDLNVKAADCEDIVREALKVLASKKPR